MQKKITSPKLKIIIVYGLIISIIALACVIVSIVFANVYVPSIYIILASIEIFCLIQGGLILFLYYKELKKITNGSVEYYSRMLPNYFTDVLIFVFCFFISALLFIKDIAISLSTLINIFVSLFSLIFALYVFILPIYKKQIMINHNKLNNLHVRKHNDETILNKLHGKIYKNYKNLNHLSVSIFVATTNFVIGIITYVLFSNAPITYFIMLASILFDINFIFKIIHITHKIYSFKLDFLKIYFDKQSTYKKK